VKDSEKTKEQLIAENEELRQRVAALEAGERRFRTVIDLVPLTIGEVNRDGVVIFANAATEKMFGYTPEEIVGTSAWDRIEEGPPREAFRAWFRRTMSEQPPPSPVFGSRVKKNGKRIDIRGDWDYLRNEKGEVAGLVTVVADITEGKRAERELAKHRVMLQVTIDCLPFNFFAIGLDGRYMLQNAVSKAQQGADVVGRRPEEVCPNEHDLAIWLDNNRRAFAGEKVEGEVTLSLTGGERFYYNVIAPISDGRELYGILGVNVDITERKRAEEALQKAHDELEEKVKERTAELTKANDELRAIYEGMFDGLLIVDVETKRYVKANLSICRMLGYAEAELTSMSVMDIHPLDEVPIALGRIQARAEGRLHGHVETRVLRKDGDILYADVVGSRLTHAGRRCVVSFFRDITERKRAEEALERERQSLWRMLQASDHERQTISYEIHDGLAQYLAAATMQFQSHDALRESSPEQAKKAYETALELVRQSHAEARRLVSEVRPPVIDEIGLETAISHLVHEQRRHGGPNIECHSDVQFGKLPPILENALYRIVQEALTNACKHSKSKKVTVTMTQQGQDVRLEVQDWGIGFDPESVEKGHFGLEGIRQRVRLLGGRLTIKSTPGSGTLVQAVIPILEEQNGE
jgi:PAS domain S-box-containing protein